ncbi:MAG: class I SAM-dependent methyltransferase [Myxococcales bacterium]|nr:class I SAM-dependent methyltransferase [Myxococcales bacterium]
MALTPDQDAFGQMLLDTLAGETGYEVCERDDGLIEVGRAGELYLKLPRRPDPGTRDLLDAARGRVLDVGCGGGRPAIALQRRGHDVLGIDTSPGALEAARMQGLEQRELMSVTRVGRAMGEFDTVLMGGHNFGLMQNPTRARWLLGRFAAITGADGQILATSFDVTQSNDPRHVAYQQRNRAAGKLGGELRLRVRWKDLKTPFFPYLMVSPDQMREIVAPTAWQLDRIIPLGGPSYAAVLRKT